jgi:hypothetical protein
MWAEALVDRKELTITLLTKVTTSPKNFRVISSAACARAKTSASRIR